MPFDARNDKQAGRQQVARFLGTGAAGRAPAALPNPFAPAAMAAAREGDLKGQPVDDLAALVQALSGLEAEASALLAAGGEKLRAGARADSASEEARSKHKGANAARSAGYVSQRKSASTSFKGERSNGRLGLHILSRL